MLPGAGTHWGPRDDGMEHRSLTPKRLLKLSSLAGPSRGGGAGWGESPARRGAVGMVPLKAQQIEGLSESSVVRQAGR